MIEPAAALPRADSVGEAHLHKCEAGESGSDVRELFMRASLVRDSLQSVYALDQFERGDAQMILHAALEGTMSSSASRAAAMPCEGDRWLL
jgi:hypothetical protein